MRLLLDTHVFLWWVQDEPLAPEAGDAIAAAREVYLSAASVIEMAIKEAIGKLRVQGDPEEAAAAHGFLPLPITLAHAKSLRHLPLHHRDPFDRLLVAQAMAEGLTLVSADGALGRYGVDLLPAR